ncbi:MAG: ribosome silencing factor, partial [Leptothrix sp. (in: b-proteobacteria)]
MDIRKLQRAIVDGLEDVKGQDIVVFNTEHLSPLFERVIVASGTSNRQAKALAASVRDAVRAVGGSIRSTEGSDNGEWIIVDCGTAVVHVMQPAIRQYYHLEEIWGGKPVKLKIATAVRGLVKASADDDSDDEDEPAAKAVKPAKRKAASQADVPAAMPKPAAKKVAAKVAKKAAKKTPVRQAAAVSEPASKAPARQAAGKSPAARKTPAAPAADGATRSPPRKSGARAAPIVV